MATEQKDNRDLIDEATESFTLWMPRSLLQKLNRIAVKRSGEDKLWSKQDVVRELVRRVKE